MHVVDCLGDLSQRRSVRLDSRDDSHVVHALHLSQLLLQGFNPVLELGESSFHRFESEPIIGRRNLFEAIDMDRLHLQRLLELVLHARFLLVVVAVVAAVGGGSSSSVGS